MNRNIINLLFLAAIGVAVYYGYQQGYFKKEVAIVEQSLNDICDPREEDCSAIEEDLEA